MLPFRVDPFPFRVDPFSEGKQKQPRVVSPENVSLPLKNNRMHLHCFVVFQRHTAEGRQRGFEAQIRGIKKELQSDMYKGAAEKYRNKVIEVRVSYLDVIINQRRTAVGIRMPEEI